MKAKNRLKVIMMEISSRHNNPDLLKELEEKIKNATGLHKVSVQRILRNSPDQPLSVNNAQRILPVLNQYGTTYTLNDLYS